MARNSYRLGCTSADCLIILIDISIFIRILVPVCTCTQSKLHYLFLFYVTLLVTYGFYCTRSYVNNITSIITNSRKTSFSSSGYESSEPHAYLGIFSFVRCVFHIDERNRMHAYVRTLLSSISVLVISVTRLPYSL